MTAYSWYKSPNGAFYYVDMDSYDINENSRQGGTYLTAFECDSDGRIYHKARVSGEYVSRCQREDPRNFQRDVRR